jgi:hypothetical protein
MSIGRPRLLHRFASPRRNLCDSATCRLVPPRNLRPSFEAKPAKPSPGGFEAQPTKPPQVAYSIHVPHHSTRVTAILNRPAAKSFRAPLDRRLHSVNMVTPMYTCVCRCLQMSATAAGHLASWSLGPSLTSVFHRSWSIGTARPYLTFTSPSTTASELHNCAPQAKRHVAQPNSRHG